VVTEVLVERTSPDNTREQHFAYDVWWHLNDDVAVTSEWATPSMIEDGLNPEDLLGRRFGHHLDFWSLSEGRLVQRIDLGDEHQMVLELRPAHDPRKLWGFVGVVISVEDLSASVWLWHREDERWAAKKVITIPAEPAEASALPPALQPFGAVPPLVSDIDLSVDDRWLYVSCWGTGELKQYDVSDPHNPREAASVRLGGIVDRTPHPAAPELRLAGGPQMVEVSRDGRRVYFTNSLHASWDDIFYPDGVGAWMARINADTATGGMTVDPKFFPHGDDFRGRRVHRRASRGGRLQRLVLLRRLGEQTHSRSRTSRRPCCRSVRCSIGREAGVSSGSDAACGIPAKRKPRLGSSSRGTSHDAGLLPARLMPLLR
jgi:selenium-binding protein 1